ncbi:MAG TPA: subclass B3 metallo-beta-lactamase [Bryobacteraceae bacterium]|nr:subclass B3 metallo-beta-lactamase [Bryobacteraceae bacterium]
MERLARFLFPAMLLAAAGTAALMAQAGKVWTAAELFTRNIGTKEDQDTAFPPHKIIGNLYYVGTRSLGTFLIVTPQGDILINSDYERTVPVIKSSVEKLGFKFTDIKILLGSHAHGDHMEGDALAQELSGAQVMAMAEDIPALQTMRTPSGKARPNYKVIHDGDKVTLGGTTLVAHLTPGHTRGCTTWTASIEDGGRSYDVVIIGSVGVNQGTRLVNNPQVPQIAEEYQRSFRILRGLKCDVPLGSHPAMYNLAEKYPKLGKGPNPFIDPQGYKTELDIQETAFNAVLDEQKKAANERK